MIGTIKEEIRCASGVVRASNILAFVVKIREREALSLGLGLQVGQAIGWRDSLIVRADRDDSYAG